MIMIPSQEAYPWGRTNPSKIRRVKMGAVNIAMTGAGKIVFSSKTIPDVHYTVNLGGKSGVFDIHKTTVGKDGNTYETIGAARLEELIVSLGPVTAQLVSELLAARRRLKLGWLHHNYIGIVSGLFPDINSPAINIKGSTLELSADSMSGQVRWVEYLEEVFEIPDEAFALFKVSRKQQPKFVGVGFKQLIPNRSPVLYWIKIRDLRRWIARTEGEFTAAVQALQLHYNG